MMRRARQASAAWALAIVAGAAAANPAYEAGRALYAGSAPLQARMPGHTQALPPGAARCANCHQVDAQRASAPGYGPRLNRPWLAQPQARRGGPPSRYDAQALCSTLRTGVDPAGVMLPAAMPRYDIDDAACRALWVYFTAGTP